MAYLTGADEFKQIIEIYYMLRQQSSMRSSFIYYDYLSKLKEPKLAQSSQSAEVDKFIASLSKGKPDKSGPNFN